MLEKTKGKVVRTDRSASGSSDKGDVPDQASEVRAKLYGTPCPDRLTQGCMKARS